MLVTKEQVTEIYVATFNRAPDADGLDYWVNDSDLDLNGIAESFWVQPETQAHFSGMSDKQVVTALYQQLFNRSSDEAGLDYWVEEIIKGNVDKADIVLALINGAQDTITGNDKTTMDNKTEVGMYFAQHAQTLTIEDAYNVMSMVTADYDSVEQAIEYIEDRSGAYGCTLTTAIDHVVCTSDDDDILGIVDGIDPSKSTLNPDDIIDGNDGDDTLVLELVGAHSQVPKLNMESVETLQMSNMSPVDTEISLDLVETTGLEMVSLDVTTPYSIGPNMWFGTIYAELVNVDHIVDIKTGSSKGFVHATKIDIYYDPAVVAGGDDSMHLGKSDDSRTDTTQYVSAEGIETFYITDVSEVEILNDTSLHSIIVDGQTGTILTGNMADAKFIDFSSITSVSAVSGVESSILDPNSAEIVMGIGEDVVNLSENKATDMIVYTNAEYSLYSHGDFIHSFETGYDKIHLSAAISNAGGYSTGQEYNGTITINNTVGNTLMDGDVMTSIVMRGGILVNFGVMYYIDANTNGRYDKNDDMAIIITTAGDNPYDYLHPEDFIV